MKNKSLNIKMRRFSYGCLAAIAFAAPIAAFAAQTADSSSDSGALEEIVVTAQKREENLQSVPISAQVVTGQTLAHENYNSLDELSQTLPAVHIGNAGGTAASNDLYIRGIGSGVGGGNQAFDQSVAIFEDDIYHGRSRMSNSTFLDLERVEVLKGPQSTFFGNNAVAGALNLVSKKPGDTFDASTRLLYGMHGQYAAEAEATLPITDILSVRAAGIFDGGSGWIKDINTGKDAPDESNMAGRITAVLRPTEDFDATLKVESSRNKTSGSSGDEPYQFANCPPPAPLNAGFAGTCAQALAGNLPIGFNNNLDSGLAGQGVFLTNLENVLTLNYRQWGQLFTSVSGFYNYHFTQNTDVGQLPIFYLTNQMYEKYHQFSQEFRVTSANNGPVQYMVGAYFQTDGLTEINNVVAPFIDPLAVLFDVPAQYLPFDWHPNFTQDEKVYSLFGSLSLNVTDLLRLNTGLRASSVHKEFDGNNQYGTTNQIYGGFIPEPFSVETHWTGVEGAPGTANLSRTDHALMPSAGIQYQVTPAAMGYFTYTKGFKAGGFNGETPYNPTSGDLEFGPEHVNSYELGLKSKWFDNTVLFNIDVFREDYQDLQANALIFNTVVNAYTQVVRNAATSRSQGVELETQWAASKDLRFAANVTYLDSIYVSYPNGSPQQLQYFCTKSYVLPYCAAFPQPVPAYADLSGQATNFAPRWSGSVSAAYIIPLPGGYNFTTEIKPYFTSSYNEQDPYVLGTAGYVRLDGRLSFSAADERWAVDLIGKNLTDKVIVTSQNTKEEPLNVAVQLRYHF